MFENTCAFDRVLFTLAILLRIFRYYVYPISSKVNAVHLSEFLYCGLCDSLANGLKLSVFLGLVSGGCAKVLLHTSEAVMQKPSDRVLKVKLSLISIKDLSYLRR
jgi:hypothetical protein